MCSIGEVMRAAMPNAFILESETIISKNEKVTVQDSELKDDEFLIYEALEHQSSLKISDVVSILDKKRVLPVINSLVENFDGIEFYTYYIETDHDVDLTQYRNTHEIADYLLEGLNSNVQQDVQWIDSLSDFDRFYLTDHHWNEIGQLIGYNNIINLMGIEPNFDVEVLKLEDCSYVGSKAKIIDDYSVIDTFGIIFNPNLSYKVYINGEEGIVNQKPGYYNGYYSKEIGVNHYALCYGYDQGLLEYDFEQEDKDNLLIFSASFSNPINELIASHFDHTYVVDLRHYEDDMNNTFEMSKFVADHSIDKVLYLGFLTSFIKEEFLVPLE
jgi:hypothetical protein